MKRVLIADEEPNTLLSLEFLMKQAGYDVSTTADGEAALQSIAENPPDLVLLDINMLKQNGCEVCATVRTNPESSNIKIVMLTSKGREIENEKGLAMGADDYIVKPFSSQEVVNKVNQLLGCR